MGMKEEEDKEVMKTKRGIQNQWKWQWKMVKHIDINIYLIKQVWFDEE